MGFKEWYFSRLKKRTVISYLNGEKVYLAKGSIIPTNKMKEWSQIYPAVDEETGKVIWVNLIFGGWRNLIKLLVILGIATLVLLQFKENYAILHQAIECCNRCNNINLWG
jgi:hypothetical protein